MPGCCRPPTSKDRPPDGWPVVLSHGFPSDEVAPVLTAHRARVVRPYLRGFGPTRFRSAARFAAGSRPPSAPT
jgi:pimeloyl-ACP methyl ester carboxylesterase